MAPYKVIKIHLDIDIEGYRPEEGQLDRYGNEIEDRIYNSKDFDRNIVIEERTRIVAKKISDFLKESGDRWQKTIVFCVDVNHAGRMRQALVNENADLVSENSRYVMRITGDDKEGKIEVDKFIDPETKEPVIVTTSRLLSTGVDAQTCRLIVLDKHIGSMTEFKQIVGRGTRIHEDTKKFYFTLMDFRGASNHFADPEFDGEPVQIYEPTLDDPITPPETLNSPEEGETILDPPDIAFPTNPTTSQKLYIDGVEVTILAERVEYLDHDGKLITKSLRDFSKRTLQKRFVSLDRFLHRWRSTERKQIIIDELANEGILLNVLAEEVGKDFDPFDLICHVAFDKPPLTRKQRAENVRKRDIFTKYGQQARQVLEALLEKYQDGVIDLDDPKILQINPFNTMGTTLQLIKEFGDSAKFKQAVYELQNALYAA